MHPVGLGSGVARALLSLCVSINFIILIKLLYTQYVIIAYGFIMYYNTEVQIIATICNK